MSGRKHGAIQLSRYVQIHNNAMDRFLRGNFVLSEGLEFYPADGSIVIEGTIFCIDGLEIQVKKRLLLVGGSDDDPLVRTEYYIYNLHIPGQGPVFRYNSPHGDHNMCHHAHRYDIFEGDTAGTVEQDFNDDAWPTLSEVIVEAEGWYYANVARLKEMGLI